MKAGAGILVASPDLRPSLVGLLRGLSEAGLLARVVTTVALDPSRLQERWLLRAAKGFRRAVPEFLAGKVDRVASRELVRILASRIGSRALAHRVWRWAETGFDAEVARRYAGLYECVYGMEHASLETFRAQKNAGGSCVLRQVICHAREVSEMILEETRRHPQYADEYLKLLLSDLEATAERKEAEYGLADLIMANSEFVKETFIKRGFPDGKVAAVPTGFPSVRPRQKKIPGKPLVFYFAGSLSLRKGLPYLLAAWRKAGLGARAQLRLAGPMEVPAQALKGADGNVCYLGVLSGEALRMDLERADVFVMPSLLEGRSHAVLEAIALGLPAITTAQSGCGDVVENGVNGLIVPARNSEALAAAFDFCASNSERLPDWGAASAARAARWSTQDADEAHLKILKDFLQKKAAHA